MTKTQQKTQIPFSMEVAAGIVAARCYQDRQFYQGMLKDPLETASQLISKETEISVDLKEELPNCKIHVLKNDNKRWHIVLPFEYHGEKPSLEEGFLTEDDLEQVAGGVFGLTAIGVSGLTAALGVTITTIGAQTMAVAGMWGVGGVAAAGYLSAGAIAGITAGVVAGGVALSAGIAVSAIAGLDAADIIDVW